MNIKPVEKKDITCDLYYCFEDGWKCEHEKLVYVKDIRAALEWYKKYSGNLSLFELDYPVLYDQLIRIVEMEVRHKLGSTSVQYLLDEFLLKQAFRGVYDND